MTRLRQNQLLVWAVVWSQFGPSFMFSGVAVALPRMGADLGAGATSLGLVETLFLAGSVAFLLPVGRLSDSGDKKTLYKLGLLLFGFSSLLIGLVSSMPVILVIRFLQGVSAAVFSATGMAVLADLVPLEQRGRVYGHSQSAIYSGLTLGPILAGFLIDFRGWRAVFLAGAAMILLGYLLIHRRMPSAWRRPARAFHVPSAGLLVVAMLCLVAGSATLGEGRLSYLYLLGGLLLGAVFVIMQQGLKQPLLDVAALMSNHVLRNALLVQLLLYMSAFASVFMLSIYLQVTLGRSANTSGQLIAAGAALMALTAPVAGILADRYRPGLISSAGVACVLASGLLAMTLSQDSRLSSVALVLIAQGLGFGLFSTPNITVIMSSMSHEVSMASALSAKARSLGMVFGMLVTALLISLTIGDHPLDQHAGAFNQILVTGFAILAGLNTLALIVSFLTRTSR